MVNANSKAIDAFLKTTAGESFEEVVSDIANIVADRLFGWNDGEGNVLTDIIDQKNDILYDALLGGFMGAIGGVGTAQNAYNAATMQNAIAKGVDAAIQANVESNADVDTTPEGTQNAEAQKNTAPNGTGTQYSKAYDADGAADIRRETSKFKNVVVDFDTSVKEFFNKWAGGRKSHQGEKLEKLYLGEITDAARAKLSELLGYEVTSSDYILTNDGVKHIIDQHGDTNAEIKKGNLPITDAILDSLPDVLAHPDNVDLGKIENRGDRMGIVFKKIFRMEP